jgi:hypothetical protein
MDEVGINVKRMVDAMVKAKGYAYTTGCLETMLIDLIRTHVKDESQLQMMHIRFLGRACECLLEAEKAA